MIDPKTGYEDTPICKTAKCNRCGNPDATHKGYELFDHGDVCSICWQELNSINYYTHSCAPGVRDPKKVAALAMTLQMRCVANDFETPMCDDCGIRAWENQVYREKDYGMARLCDHCLRCEVSPDEVEAA